MKNMQGCWVIAYHRMSVWPWPRGQWVALPPQLHLRISTAGFTTPDCSCLHAHLYRCPPHPGGQRAQGHNISPYTGAQCKPLTLQHFPRGSYGETEAQEKEILSQTADGRTASCDTMQGCPSACMDSHGDAEGRWAGDG